MWLVILAGLVVLLCIVAHQMLRHHVTAVVHATEYTMADHPVMEIEIQNSGRTPLFLVKAVLQIENRVFEETKKIGYTGLVAAHSNKRFAIPLDMEYPGTVSITVPKIIAKDFFHLSFFQIALEKKEYFTTIMPQTIRLDRLAQVWKENYEKERFFLHRKGNNLSEILQYRNYVRGDSRKNINWKLSAKYDEWIVREFDTPTDNFVLITFDVPHSLSKEERKRFYEVLVSICQAYMQQKVVYNIGWFDYESRHFICYEIVDFAHYLKAVSLLMKNSPTDAKDRYDSLQYLRSHKEVGAKYARVIYVTEDLTKEQQRMLPMQEGFCVVDIKKYAPVTQSLEEATGALYALLSK